MIRYHQKILKYNGDVLLRHITHIINLSFKNGNVPGQIKLAKIMPIYKKNKTHLPENYRPISLLNTLIKQNYGESRV